MATSTLNEVVLELQEQNKTLDDVKNSIKSMLAEDILARKQEERAAGDREEDRREASKQKARSGQAPSFQRGLLGNTLSAGFDKVLSGMFGAAGGLLPALAMGAGRGIRFGAAALALNAFVSDAVDYVFEGFTFDNSMTDDEKNKIKKDTQDGLNAGLGAKFLGLSWRKSLGIGLGVAASDLIGDTLKERFATDESGQFVMGNPLSGLGIGGEEINIDLSDPATRDIIGGAIGLVGIEIARYAARGFLRLGARGIAIALGAAGFATLANLMQNMAGPNVPDDGSGNRGKTGGGAAAKAAAQRRVQRFAQRSVSGKLTAADLRRLTPDELRSFGYQRLKSGAIRAFDGDPTSPFLKHADVASEINKKLLARRFLGTLGRAAPLAVLGYDAYLGMKNPYYREDLDMGAAMAAAAGIGEGTANFADTAQGFLPGQVGGLPMQAGMNLYRLLFGLPTEPLQLGDKHAKGYRAFLDSLFGKDSGKTFYTEAEYAKHLEQSRAKFKDTGQIIKGVGADATGALQLMAESYASQYGPGAPNIVIGTLDQSTNVDQAPQAPAVSGNVQGAYGTAVNMDYIEKLMAQGIIFHPSFKGIR